MTMREHMLALIQGRAHDRVPFVQYSGIAGVPDDEVLDLLGRDRVGLLRWCGAHRLDAPHCRFEAQETTRDGEPVWRRTLVTPEGELSEERILVPAMGQVTSITEHYVQTPDDYRVLTAYLRDVTVVEDATSVEQAIADFGDQGLPHVHLGRTPFQQLWVQWVSMMDLSMHLVDAPDVVEECMTVLGELLMQIAEAAFAAAGRIDIPYVVVGDNITAPLIGQERFGRWCVPYYRRIAERMAERDLPLVVHMDGDLKPLWGAIGDSGVRGLDSFSPPPDNDTSVADAVRLWPEMRLMVNFPSSVHLADEAAIYEQTRTILDQGGRTGRLQIQISENMPPGAWRKSYPQIVRAIDDFHAGEQR